jgi:predicted ATPase
VGYGVSQVIPIVYAIAQPDYDIVLLQQPEVHLHPRAQAGLGSLLLSASRDKTIIAETHSDYIIDRVRVDLRKSRGRIDPEDIAIYYFEREGPRVIVQRIRLDEYGNIFNPPRGYRRFFIQHENTLLGLDNVSDH